MVGAVFKNERKLFGKYNIYDKNKLIYSKYQSKLQQYVNNLRSKIKDFSNVLFTHVLSIYLEIKFHYVAKRLKICIEYS